MAANQCYSQHTSALSLAEERVASEDTTQVARSPRRDELPHLSNTAVTLDELQYRQGEHAGILEELQRDDELEVAAAHQVPRRGEAAGFPPRGEVGSAGISTNAAKVCPPVVEVTIFCGRLTASCKLRHVRCFAIGSSCM